MGLYVHYKVFYIGCSANEMRSYRLKRLQNGNEIDKQAYITRAQSTFLLKLTIVNFIPIFSATIRNVPKGLL